MRDFTLLLGPPPLKTRSGLQQHKGHLTRAGRTETFTPSVASTKPPFLWQPPPVVKRNLSGIPALEPHRGREEGWWGGPPPCWAELLVVVGQTATEGLAGADPTGPLVGPPRGTTSITPPPPETPAAHLGFHRPAPPGTFSFFCEDFSALERLKIPSWVCWRWTYWPR